MSMIVPRSSPDRATQLPGVTDGNGSASPSQISAKNCAMRWGLSASMERGNSMRGSLVSRSGGSRPEGLARQVGEEEQRARHPQQRWDDRQQRALGEDRKANADREQHRRGGREDEVQARQPA